MTEIIDSYYMVERDLEYAEFEFEEVPLRVYDHEKGDWVETSSFFSGTVRIDEDFRIDWINIGVELNETFPSHSIQRELFYGLEEGVKDYIRFMFAEWKTTLPAEVML